MVKLTTRLLIAINNVYPVDALPYKPDQVVHKVTEDYYRRDATTDENKVINTIKDIIRSMDKKK